MTRNDISTAAEAWPIRKILDARTGEQVGAEYMWDDGQRALYWFDEAVNEIRFEALDFVPPPPLGLRFGR
ncbi:hypothetical protein [Jannaschia aquimarina]|uniref:Uncharacterized protein n=1 Tax=Jannaschia aquimarina TaxID=935700 RepID=A0A0D1ELC6_9RHOB|nr:hypothetical protein [Jannaschia aquimarina]KIT16580.1 hypothetical protein jaqu_16750 [Jannaschia aquimarina]SNT41566.1 hypothetical protein SAMN05421775_11718 [Jannaschia aquimarina]